MNGLRTARVLVVDDTPEQAMPIIEFWGRMGIGCVYVRGDKLEDLPTQSIAGVRIGFIDMKLNVEGEAKQVVGKTVNVLKTVLAEDSLPIIIVAWTQHPDLVATFKEVVSQQMPSIKPLIVHQMEKPMVNNKISVAAVIPQIKALLRRYLPARALWTWEQMVHDAASDTSTVLASAACKRITDDGGDANDVQRWCQGLSELLRALAGAGAGGKEDKISIRNGLLEAMNSLHLDRLQAGHAADFDPDARLISKVSNPKLADSQKAALNSMMLLSSVAAGRGPVSPGNVYAIRRQPNKLCALSQCRVAAKAIADGMPIKLTKDAEYNTLHNQLNKARNSGKAQEAAALQKKEKARERAIIGSCLSVLVEITPACAFAQGKRKMARFVSGLLVPGEHAKVFKWSSDEAPPFLKPLETVTIPRLKGTWCPILDARYVFGVLKPDDSVRCIPLCRLRESVLVDIQAWFASYVARPGYLSIR